MAETDSRILALDEETLWKLVNASHAVARNLLYTLVKRMRYENTIIIGDREKTSSRLPTPDLSSEGGGPESRPGLACISHPPYSLPLQEKRGKG